MRFYVAYGVFLLLLSATAGVVLARARRDSRRRLLILTAGAFAMLCALVFPFGMEASPWALLRNVFLTFLEVMQIFAMNLGFLGETESLGVPAWFAWLYSITLSALYVAAPLFAAGYLLTCSRRASAQMRWLLSRGDETWFFSEASEKAMMLARDVLSREERPVVVFCCVSGDACDRVAEMGAIGLGKDVGALGGSFFRRRDASVFFMGDDEERNLDAALDFIRRHSRDERFIFVYPFTSRPEAELLLNAADMGRIICRRIAENRAMVYREIEDTPLIGQEEVTRILLVGCGWIGMEMLKALLWSCVRKGHRLAVEVVDRRAVSQRFYRECPGLRDYGVRFFENEDIHAFDVNRLSDPLSVSHVYIALGSDAQNLECAIGLRQAFRRVHRLHAIDDTRMTPQIHVALNRLQDTAMDFRDRGGQPYDILPLGCGRCGVRTAGCYTEDTLFNYKLELRALIEHLGYDAGSRAGNRAAIEMLRKAAGEPMTHRKWRAIVAAQPEAVSAFYRYEYNVASSRAKALFAMCCARDGVGYSPEEEEGGAVPLYGCVTEHERWMMFMLTAGYQHAAQTDHMAKLHRDIVDYAALDDTARAKDRSTLLEDKPAE